VVLCAALLSAGLTAVASAGGSPLAFPGKPGRIAFESDRGASTDLFTVDSRGRRPIRLTKADAYDDYWAQWSPNGRALALTRSRGDRDEVWVLDTKTRRMRRLAPGWDPTWSRDASRIAYAFGDAQDTEIYAVPARGGRPVDLTNDPGTDVAPAWSPDGKRIAFASDRGRAAHDLRLWVMNADGTNPKPLGDLAGSVPNWAPDGKRLVFLGERGGIFVVRADGTGLRRVVANDRAEGPAWSPDGRRIAFVISSEDFGGEIFVVNADGRGLRRLTRDGYDDHSPDWQPVR
jgi:TolB protein